MANPEHLEIVKQGVEQWNKWRKDHLQVRPELSGADLYRAKLGEAKLSGANLAGANLNGADLAEADLSQTDLLTADLPAADLTQVAITEEKLGVAMIFQTDLRSASLRGANLHEANLGRADLSHAVLERAILWDTDLVNSKLIETDLRGTALYGANLDGANLAGADFTHARAGKTHFVNVDLSETKGLESIQHGGPSTVGIDTIYKSHGKIPEAFLRGCGVPDGFIAYIGSMVGRPTEFYSCFISYSTKDQEFADRLYADLQAKGVRCWFAPHDIKGGETISEQIDKAIRQYDRLLLILSEHSINSGWVGTEIANGWERQIQQGKHVLFPVRLVSFEELEKWKCPDPKTGKDLGREIRKYFIPDFSNWKNHDSYQKAFQRLVEDLKAVVSSQ